VARTQEQVTAFLSRSLVDLDLPVVMLDGVCLAEHGSHPEAHAIRGDTIESPLYTRRSYAMASIPHALPPKDRELHFADPGYTLSGQSRTRRTVACDRPRTQGMAAGTRLVATPGCRKVERPHRTDLL